MLFSQSVSSASMSSVWASPLDRGEDMNLHHRRCHQRCGWECRGHRSVKIKVSHPSMRIYQGLFAFVCVLAWTTVMPAQKTLRSMSGSAAKSGQAANLKVAPDLYLRVEKFRRVQMPMPSAGLTANERKMVEKLVVACRYLEDIYWRQNDPEGLALYQSLEHSTNHRDQLLRRYMWINASRFDLLDNNMPFVGIEMMSPGRGFYPPHLTREQVDKFVKEHPEKKAEIYSSTTVVRWHGDQLEALPYHIAYRAYLEP